MKEKEEKEERRESKPERKMANIMKRREKEKHNHNMYVLKEIC